MKTLDCIEGEGLVIDGEIFIEVIEIAEDEVCLKIELPEGMAGFLEEELDAVT